MLTCGVGRRGRATLIVGCLAGVSCEQWGPRKGAKQQRRGRRGRRGVVGGCCRSARHRQSWQPLHDALALQTERTWLVHLYFAACACAHLGLEFSTFRLPSLSPLVDCFLMTKGLVHQGHSKCKATWLVQIDVGCTLLQKE